MKKLERGLKQFRSQHGNARTRGIAWSLTFEQWWDFWQKSGHYRRRGQGPDNYALARIDPTDGYHLGNIICCTNREAAERYWQSSLRPQALKHNRAVARSRRRWIQTPLGRFLGLAAAAKRHRISEGTIRSRIHSQNKDYYYIT